MTTSDVRHEEPSASGTGPSPFSEDEIASATAGPAGDPELDGVEPADIDEQAADAEASFERLAQRAKRLDSGQVERVVESVLFLSDKPLTLHQLFEATAIDRERLTQALEALIRSRSPERSGVVLHEVDGGWQLRSAPETAEYARRFLKVKPQRLTRAAIETLAIIAYRQPVTRPEIEEIRGVDSGAVLKALLDRKLVKILGKKDEVGRPILYGTTREFLEFFALKDLASLPTLREFHELTEEHQEIVEQEAAPPPQGTIEALADPTFTKKLEENAQASEAALEELERALSTADTRAKQTAAFLGGAPTEASEKPDAG